MQANENSTSVSQFIEQEHGPVGSKSLEEFEAGYEVFKLGALLQQARHAKGLTQQQLADLAGTNKAYISKLENDLKDVRLSTLQRIISEGLGGHLEFSIKF